MDMFVMTSSCLHRFPREAESSGTITKRLTVGSASLVPGGGGSPLAFEVELGEEVSASFPVL
jgi:hypothetical protein